MDAKNTDLYSLQWKNVCRDWPLWILMAGLLVTAIMVYPHLPDQVPRHWNIKGEVDAYFSRTYGAFVPPLMVIGIYLLMLLLPLIDPKRNNYRRFTSAYSFLRWVLVILFAAIYISTIFTALGFQVNEGLLVKALIAVLFIVIGNFMGQFRHNYFVGIKTPWTLANEAVWQKTHRLGGKIWVIGGLVCLAMSVSYSDWAAMIYFVSIIAMAIIPIVYSYIIFMKLKG